MTMTESKPTRAKGRTDITYYHDGKAMPGTHKHKLSTLAYFHSGTPRLSTKDFTEALKALGVDNPAEPGWIVKLPHGTTVECRLDGEPSTYDGPAPARKATPRNEKGQIQAKPAKPRSSVKKQTPGAKAKKATKQVTPIPKGGKRPTRAN